jgi:hypothetical protein
MEKEIRIIAEKCLKPRSSLNEASLLQLRPYLESFLDPTWLNTKIKIYEDWALTNSAPLLQRTLLHCPLGFNKLVASIWVARDWEKIYNSDKSFRVPAGAKWLINIAVSIAILEFYTGTPLNKKAHQYLQRRFQNAEHLWSVSHELQTFAFFVRQGVKAEPHFLKEGSHTEIMLNWKGVEIPVQCKAKLPGSGRILSQNIFTSLACSIALDARVQKRKIIVRIGATNQIRLEDVEFLRKHVAFGIGSIMGPALVTNNGRTYSLRIQPLRGTFTTNTIRGYLSSFNFHIGMVIGEPTQNGEVYDAVAIVGIEANLYEKPWNSLLSSIQKATRQLEEGPAGIVAIHYADPISDFETLRPDNRPLSVVLGKLLNPLPHMGAVILTAEPDLQLPKINPLGRVQIYYKRPWPFPKDFLFQDKPS